PRARTGGRDPLVRRAARETGSRRSDARDRNGRPRPGSLGRGPAVGGRPRADIAFPSVSAAVGGPSCGLLRGPSGASRGSSRDSGSPTPPRGSTPRHARGGRGGTVRTSSVPPRALRADRRPSPSFAQSGRSELLGTGRTL